MASPPPREPSQRNAPSSYGGNFSPLHFWEHPDQHEGGSMQDQHDPFGDTSVDPEPEPPILRSISSASLKVDLKSELGKGVFAKVYKGRLVEKCAVKVFNDKVLGDDVVKEFKRMRNLKHPYIVRVFGMIPAYKIEGRNALVIAMELCDMSLDQYIKERFRKGISKVKFLQILHDIASAMVYLHSQGIVHGDLRSPNVLVIELGDIILAKLTDFGMTGCLNEPGDLTTTTFTYAKYLPPEVFVNYSSKSGFKKNWVKLSRKVDVFCFGPIAIELGCGEFPEPTAKSYMKKGIVAKTFTEIQRREKHIKNVKKAHSECIELIVQQCMQDRPEERASFSDILLIVEGFQKQCKKRPDSEWIKKRQYEIEDLRAQMEADQEAMKQYKLGTDQNWKEMVSEQDALKLRAEELEHDLRTKDQAMQDLEGDLQASKKECTRLQQLVDSLKTDEKKTNAAKEELERKLCASQKAKTSLKAQLGECHQLKARLEEDLKMVASGRDELTVQLKSTAVSALLEVSTMYTSPS